VKRTIGVAVALLVLLAAPASAHVSANPGTVEAGEAAAITFRVPNETSDANTTSVEIAMPEGASFEFVSVKPVAGWEDTEKKSGDAVTAVTWSGGKIAPGEYQEFSISFGPVEAGSLEFKALQTYDNGEIVRWIDPTVEGEEEPEHPAPTVTVTKEGAGDEAAATTDDASDSGDKGEDGTDTATFAALALGGVALVAALAALIMGRRRIPS
jgi:uncharacterized protein YcnI